MQDRRRFIRTVTLSSAFLAFRGSVSAATKKAAVKPVVLSTWFEQAANANEAAWKVLAAKGRALDAVEQGVRVTESEVDNCCVGLNAMPDRDGIVTLDACIMDEHANCGAVMALEQIDHPISVARLVMEKTPHVALAGDGAQQFALANGFKLQGTKLSDKAEAGYKEWLEKAEYRPIKNIEKGDKSNHDTIGMIALDAHGNLSGACTTSGMRFKMHGRVGDSPIIGAGLYVDNEIGAAVATGVGEEMIRICGTHLVVEFMRQGHHPEQACKMAVERIIKKSSKDLTDAQVGFLALNKQGEYGGYALQAGFDYAICTPTQHNLKLDAKHLK